MGTFRLAHITDLHFGDPISWLNPLDNSKANEVEKARGVWDALLKRKARSRAADLFYPSTFNPEVALALLRTLEEELPFLDAVLVTGDLATTGDKSDLKLARDFFAGNVPLEWNPLSKSLPSLLTDSEYLLVSLPGNHDRYEGITHQPISKQFESHFGTMWDFERKAPFDAFQINSASGRVRVTSLELDDSILIILMADFTLEDSHSGAGNIGYLGQGRVTTVVLDELTRATNAVYGQCQKDAEISVGCLWAVHFPPSFPSVNSSLELIDSQLLIDAAAACGVSVIVAGHTHETLMYQVSATNHAKVNVICSGPSSGISSHKTYAFTILEIEIRSTTITPRPIHYSWVGDRFERQVIFPLHQE